MKGMVASTWIHMCNVTFHLVLSLTLDNLSTSQKCFRQQKVENHLKCCAQWRLSGQMYFAASDHHYCVNVGTVIRNQCANRYDQCYRYPGNGKVGSVYPRFNRWMAATNQCTSAHRQIQIILNTNTNVREAISYNILFRCNHTDFQKIGYSVQWEEHIIKSITLSNAGNGLWSCSAM